LVGTADNLQIFRDARAKPIKRSRSAALCKIPANPGELRKSG